MVLAVCRVTAISIRISLGRNNFKVSQRLVAFYTATKISIYLLNYTPEEWEDKLEAKIEIVRGPGDRYLYRWQKLNNSPNKWSKLNCQGDLQTSLLPFFACCVLSYTLICIYFLFDKWANQNYFQFKWANLSFKSVFKRFIILTTTNAFTETLKFVSTSKGFSCCFERFALSSEQNLKYLSDHGRTYLQF